MYAGRAVETAPVDEVCYRGRRMPYTAGLLGSVPRLDAPQGAAAGARSRARRRRWPRCRRAARSPRAARWPSTPAGPPNRNW